MRLLLLLILALTSALASPVKKPDPKPDPKLDYPHYTNYTQNELVDGTPCRNLTILFARGTNNPGNVGDSTGPYFFEAVAKRVGVKNVAVQGVDYGANLWSYFWGGSRRGPKTLAGLVRTANRRCPDTKLVMSGHSQGAKVVHKAAAMLLPNETRSIDAVVLFGDPEWSAKTVANIPTFKIWNLCHKGDLICDPKGWSLKKHQGYGGNATAAAEFVISQVGL